MHFPQRVFCLGCKLFKECHTVCHSYYYHIFYYLLTSDGVWATIDRPWHEVFYDIFFNFQDRKAELGKDIDIGKYIAGGIVVFDLSARRVKWLKHLDLSTDHTQFRAYIYSSPTLVDLDADEKLEIIVGTSMVRSWSLFEQNKSP